MLMSTRPSALPEPRGQGQVGYNHSSSLHTPPGIVLLQPDSRCRLSLGRPSVEGQFAKKVFDVEVLLVLPVTL